MTSGSEHLAIVILPMTSAPQTATVVTGHGEPGEAEIAPEHGHVAGHNPQRER